MRVSVTDVDAFRYYQQSEDMDLSTVLARLRKEEPPTEHMKAGRAFHEILERPPQETMETVEHDGFRFEFALDDEISLPTIREIKGEHQTIVNGIPVTLVGVVDALHGQRADDHKLAGRFASEKYTDAFQWRAYLHMFRANQFRYNVFTGSQLKDGTWRIRAFDALDFWRYPGLERDVMHMLGEFVDFACEHLPEKMEAA